MIEKISKSEIKEILEIVGASVRVLKLPLDPGQLIFKDLVSDLIILRLNEEIKTEFNQKFIDEEIKKKLELYAKN